MLSTGLWNEVRSHSSSRPIELKLRIFNFTEVISDKKIHCTSQVPNYNLCHEILAVTSVLQQSQFVGFTDILEICSRNSMYIERSVHLNTYFYNALRVNLSPLYVLMQNYKSGVLVLT